ncbi:MAG TPA: DUF1992 domain-containing protein, partial [Tepidisphaeraceae bacterium]|nr:DUF1992 domain-containing protein [Tepidisphaeraceae bacterium]
EDAMKEGKFANLQGMGQPLDLEPMPADENVRMTWWAIRILKNNDFTPHEVQWRKQIDKLREMIDRLTDESKLPQLVARVNELARQLNTLGTNAIRLPIASIDLEMERERLRERRSQLGKRHRDTGRSQPEARVTMKVLNPGNP